MSWHIHKSMSFADFDGYGRSADNPPTPHEILDNLLNVQCERAITDGYNEWLKETAHEYFDTSDWNDEWWDGWRDIVRDLTY